MDGIITFVAKFFVLIPVLVTLYILWKLKPRQRKYYAALIVLSAVLALILAKIGSHLISDARPQFSDGSKPLFFHANDNGFPSDHTLLASLLGFCALYYSRKSALVLLAVAVLIAWARVAAHVHHLEDVVGSFVLTALSYLVIRYVVRRFWPEEDSQL